MVKIHSSSEITVPNLRRIGLKGKEQKTANTQKCHIDHEPIIKMGGERREDILEKTVYGCLE